MKRYPLLLISALCFFLNACTTIKPQEKALSEPNETKQSKESFQLSGAIAAKNQHKGWTASFYWTQQDREHYQIVLNGPMGSSSIKISMQQGTLTYQEGQRILHSQNPEALLANETGIRIPVHYLHDWIRGNPAPVHIDAITRDVNHDILSLQQAGFVLSYSQYRHHYPQKIRIEGHQLLIKIIINS